MHPLTSVPEVDRIASLPEPRSRNLHITQSYYELSLALSQRLGSYANWCTFATWASRQAGQTIRQEDMQQALEKYLHTHPYLTQTIADSAASFWKKIPPPSHSSLIQFLWEILNPKAAAVRASDAVARGNQKVYAEIAREFARFLDTCLKDQSYAPESIQSFCSALRPGNPPEGQAFLRQAFQHYYAAFFETDQKLKAELILMANIEVGFHEQTRLQPEIAEAMEAAVLDPKAFKTLLVNSMSSNGNWMQRLFYWGNRVFDYLRVLIGMPSPLDKAIADLAYKSRHHIRLFLSAHFMELGFPNGLQMPLGKDLTAHFPTQLQTITHPALILLLQQIDPTPDSLKDTGAIDWADLKDRLHFIADLFRCFQEDRDLFAPPLDEEALVPHE
ncbi:MAG TPA: hypothetical protein PKA00_18175 [Saprospiraceae bacterium]|nr:hypothetical protein [Saprospiraceae bacterium]HMQ84846.1 hypothetical protein [Saprospiraceae bacterium]